MEKLTKKYGLPTAICMVVGTVIGSGVFFKAQNVLSATGGNMFLGILAWLITGLVMIICAAQFSVMATQYGKVNGLIDYAEATCGEKYAYYLAWYMVHIYYPGMTSVLAWVSARYFGVLLGWDMTSAQVMSVAGFFLVASYTMNALSPKLAGKFQVSSTVIKLIPICLMAIVGSVYGLMNGTLVTNFTTVVNEVAGGDGGLFAAVVATVFAYEGWIVATSINAELKNAKRNLPLALILGSLIVVLAYILYFVGVAGGASTKVLIDQGATTAFINIFGGVGGLLLNICIVVSCLGTLNGLMVGATRGVYAMAARGRGPKPEMFAQVDSKTNMSHNSAIWGLFICAAWLLYFYGANLAPTSWFGIFSFDSSELPIVSIYAMYIPIFFVWMKNGKGLGVFKRFVLPLLSLFSCLFMMYAAIYAHGIAPYLAAKAEGRFVFPVLFYFIIFVVIMLIGAAFSKVKPVSKDEEEK